jgi:hypothetical protein
MAEARNCHLPNSTAFFCIGIDQHGIESVTDDLIGPGGGR